MIDLKDYDIKDGIATPKSKTQIRKEAIAKNKPTFKAKVITKDDYKESDNVKEN